MRSNMTTDTTVAQTILEQLGGRGFVMMTGARDFMVTRDGYALRFRLPRAFAKNGISVVEVHLTPEDLYDVHVFTAGGRELPGSDGVYYDALSETFRRLTGLDIRLPRIVRGYGYEQAND